MRRISFVVWIMGGVLIGGTASAQCRAGSGGASTGVTLPGGVTTATSTGTTAGALLTGPGSWAYDMMLAQAMQQQIAQRQYLLAMQQQAAYQQQLETRRYRAEQQRTQLATSRQRSRDKLLASNSSSTTYASR